MPKGGSNSGGGGRSSSQGSNKGGRSSKGGSSSGGKELLNKLMGVGASGANYLHSEGGPPNHHRPEDGPLGDKPKFTAWPGV